jgi:hypothetical protein
MRLAAPMIPPASAKAKAGKRVLQFSMARHSTAALAVFMVAAATALLLTVMRSAGIVTAIAGVLAALVVALIVPLLVDLRRPYFRTRTDVERVLELPVLATRKRRSDR